MTQGEHQVDPLVQRQLELEAECVALGEIRYNGERLLPWKNEATTKEEAALAPGKRLLTDSIKPVAAAIEAFLEGAHSGAAGRKHSAVKFLMNVSPEQAAYLTGRVAINCASERKPL